uniref:Uncharacterized protein n=1 Tax=Rhizophora mucronata TaxID=61149 RepID=A0A2P2QN77_RHIMU
MNSFLVHETKMKQLFVLRLFNFGPRYEQTKTKKNKTSP